MLQPEKDISQPHVSDGQLRSVKLFGVLRRLIESVEKRGADLYLPPETAASFQQSSIEQWSLPKDPLLSAYTQQQKICSDSKSTQKKLKDNGSSHFEQPGVHLQQAVRQEEGARRLAPGAERNARSRVSNNYSSELIKLRAKKKLFEGTARDRDAVTNVQPFSVDETLFSKLPLVPLRRLQRSEGSDNSRDNGRHRVSRPSWSDVGVSGFKGFSCLTRLCEESDNRENVGKRDHGAHTFPGIVVPCHTNEECPYCQLFHEENELTPPAIKTSNSGHVRNCNASHNRFSPKSSHNKINTRPPSIEHCVTRDCTTAEVESSSDDIIQNWAAGSASTKAEDKCSKVFQYDNGTAIPSNDAFSFENHRDSSSLLTCSTISLTASTTPTRLQALNKAYSSEFVSQFSERLRAMTQITVPSTQSVTSLHTLQKPLALFYPNWIANAFNGTASVHADVACSASQAVSGRTASSLPFSRKGNEEATSSTARSSGYFEDADTSDSDVQLLRKRTVQTNSVRRFRYTKGTVVTSPLYSYS